MTVMQIELMVAYMTFKLAAYDTNYKKARELVLLSSKEDFDKAYYIAFKRHAYDVT